MSHEVLLSKDGFEKLTKELEFLKGAERQRIAENIREAKSHGDLRENAMYHEARLNQTRLEARIGELERMLLQATVVEDHGQDGTATLGSRVTLEDLEWGDLLTIELVGAFEADPSSDRVSVDSPLGREVLRKAAGDEITVHAPAGVQRYRLVEIV